MDRDELLALDKEALVDLIVRLYERVTELEARVGRPPKGPGNSSIPPSAGYKPNRAERRRKKRGPKKGHQGLSRRRAAPDVLVRCRPTACRGCGAALAEAGQRRVRRSQVVELPELRPVVIEAWVYAARCASLRRADGRRGAGRAGGGPDVRAARRGAAGVPALRPPPLARAAGRRLRERLRPADQRGRDRGGAGAARHTGRARGGRHPGGRAGEPGDQLG